MSAARKFEPSRVKADRNMPTRALQAAHAKQWAETRTALLWECPAFSHILYTMMNPSGSEFIATFVNDEDDICPVAATDGVNLILNMDTFFKYTLKERVFVVAHEIMHCILDHMGQMHQFTLRGKVPYADGSKLDYDHTTMNIAQDYVINDLLISSKVGTYNKEWLHDPSIATGTDSAIDAYRKVYKQQQKQGGGGGGGGGSGNDKGQKQFDKHLKPGTGQGKDPTQATQDRNKQEWDTALAAAAASAKAQGKLPAGLERMFGELLNPTVDWREYIQAFFARKVGSGSYDWRRPDRRLIVRDIYAPGRSGFGAGVIAVAIDTSGSIGNAELDVFFAEMRGILEDLRPRKILLLWCDAKVHKVDELDSADDLRGLKPHGGGGTAFEPVFDWLADNQVVPDTLVYLTDGMGSFPSKPPSYPVLWGSIIEKATYPWGDVVHVPIKQK